MIFNETYNKKVVFYKKNTKIAQSTLYSTLKPIKKRHILLLWFKDFVDVGFDFGELFTTISEELSGCFYFFCQLVNGELSALDF